MVRVGFVGVWIAFVVAAGALSRDAAAQDSLAQVRAARSELFSWLSTGNSVEGWVRFLQDEELQAELQKGERADRTVVRKVLDQYESGATGLELSRFVTTRQALNAWLRDLSAPSVKELPDATLAAKSSFRTIGTTDVLRARSRVFGAVQELENLFNRSPTLHSQGWRKYLNWDDLQQQMARESPDWDKLAVSLRRLHGDAVGLEMKQFVDVRAALRGYVSSAQAAGNTKLADEYTEELDKLAGLLRTLEESSSPELRRSIGRSLGWLAQNGQAQELQGYVHRHYGKPNLFVQWSEAFVSANFDDDVNSRDDVRQGNVNGVATTKGKIRTRLQPSDANGQIFVSFDGEATANNATTTDPVTINTSSTSEFKGNKTIVLTPTGFETRPSSVTATTRLTIGNIDGPQFAIEQATSQANANRGEMEANTNRQTEARLRGQLDRRIDTEVESGSKAFNDQFRVPLVRRGATPRSSRFVTDDDRLTMEIVQAQPDQLAAFGAPPAPPGNFDYVVRMHESYLANYAAATFQGVKMTDERMAKLYEDSFGETPEELKPGPEKDPWSLTFPASPDSPPLTAVFDGDAAQFTVLGETFTRGEQEINRSMRIQAHYVVAPGSNGTRLLRQGDLTVDYVDQDRLSVGQVAFKTFLRRKFEAMFPQELVRSEMTLQKPWDKAGKLGLRQTFSKAGWLTLAWNRTGKK